MSKRNSRESKQARRILRAVRNDVVEEFRYLYEVGDDANTPGTYWPSDVRTVLMSRCTGEDCDCDDILIGAVTNNGRRLVLDVVSGACGDCLTKKLKAWARRHAIPDCVIGPEGPSVHPVMGYCERDHVCEKHPA